MCVLPSRVPTSPAPSRVTATVGSAGQVLRKRSLCDSTRSNVCQALLCSENILDARAVSAVVSASGTPSTMPGTKTKVRWPPCGQRRLGHLTTSSVPSLPASGRAVRGLGQGHPPPATCSGEGLPSGGDTRQHRDPEPSAVRGSARPPPPRYSDPAPPPGQVRGPAGPSTPSAPSGRAPYPPSWTPLSAARPPGDWRPAARPPLPAPPPP